MVTDRRLALAGVLAALILAACTPELGRCKPSTLLVSVTLDGSAANADALEITVSLDGGSGIESTIAHTPGAATGNVEVQFPRGYPTGSSAAVEVIASAGGQIVGRGSAVATLTAGCQATPLEVTAMTGVADLSVVTDGGVDLRVPIAQDLALGPDLRTSAPDLACPGGGVELCFNGIDDDCDGRVDCDDPDCAPVAVCVPPATGAFTYGTKEAKGVACPAGTTGTAIYSNSDPTGGGCTGGCSCTTSGCSATISRLTDTCPGGTAGPTLLTAGATCQNISGQNNWRAATPTGALSCASVGSATPVTPAVVPTAQACGDSRAPVAGGCTNGNVCVPRGSQQCVIAAGSAACPSGYPNQATWFTSFTDNRTCSCNCAPGGSGCAGAQVTLYKNQFGTTCSGSTMAVTGDICSNDYQGVAIAGGCNLTVTTNNPLVFGGQRTVCCQ